ncbi:unnamed protein product [Mesocestoides corti]|uniref:Reverse transcriptase domain-containing protein n=1 Tax=Mesocestoides corti TaxID=53468 RepID=A0A0R3UMW3_MESCO|nr:unnamed protein product [Mesocestoides corti]
MDTILDNNSGVAAYLDDLLTVACLRNELRKRIQIPRKKRVLLTLVKYLGFIFDSSDQHPDPENFRAKQQMPIHKDAYSLRFFWGLKSHVYRRCTMSDHH